MLVLREGARSGDTSQTSSCLCPRPTASGTGAPWPGPWSRGSSPRWADPAAASSSDAKLNNK